MSIPLASAPRNPTSFKEAGFLSDFVAVKVPEFRKWAGEWTDLYMRFNGLALRVLFSAQVKDTDLQGIFALALLNRAVATFETVWILTERGLDHDAKAALRLLTEEMIVLAAVAKDREFTPRYVYADQFQYKRLLQNTAKISRQVLSDQLRIFLTVPQIAELEQKVADIESENQGNKDFKYLKISEIAKAAGMTPQYEQHYAYLCQFAHPSAESLCDLLKLNSDGKITGFRFDANYDDALANLRIGIVFMSVMLLFAKDLFAMPIDEELGPLQRRLETLSDEEHAKYTNASPNPELNK